MRGASRVKSVSKWSNLSLMPCSCIFQRECTLAIMARTQREYLGEKRRILALTMENYFMLGGRKVTSRVNKN